MKTYVQGWCRSRTTLPPVKGHSVRLPPGISPGTPAPVNMNGSVAARAVKQRRAYKGIPIGRSCGLSRESWTARRGTRARSGQSQAARRREGGKQRQPFWRMLGVWREDGGEIEERVEAPRFVLYYCTITRLRRRWKNEESRAWKQEGGAGSTGAYIYPHHDSSIELPTQWLAILPSRGMDGYVHRRTPPMFRCGSCEPTTQAPLDQLHTASTPGTPISISATDAHSSS